MRLIIKYRDLLFREAPYNIIKVIGDSSELLYKSEISKRSGITQCHTVNTINRLQEAGIVIVHSKVGRIVWIELSDKGKELYEFYKRF